MARPGAHGKPPQIDGAERGSGSPLRARDDVASAAHARGGHGPRAPLGAMEDAAGGAVSLRALAEKGVDVKSARVTVIDGAGRSISIALLNRTAERGHKDIVEFLVEQGCDPLAIADSTGLMPHHSAYRGHVAILEWLLSRFPIPVDAANARGNTALFLAASHGQIGTTRWLIGAGANPRRLDSASEMLPSEAAEHQGYRSRTQPPTPHHPPHTPHPPQQRASR